MSNTPENEESNGTKDKGELDGAVRKLLNQAQESSEASSVDGRDVSIPARILVAMKFIELMKDSQGAGPEMPPVLTGEVGPGTLRMIHRAMRAKRAQHEDRRRSSPERATYLEAMSTVRHYISGEHGFFEFTNSAKSEATDEVSKLLRNVLEVAAEANATLEVKPTPKKKSKSKQAVDESGAPGANAGLGVPPPPPNE